MMKKLQSLIELEQCHIILQIRNVIIFRDGLKRVTVDEVQKFKTSPKC